MILGTPVVISLGTELGIELAGALIVGSDVDGDAEEIMGDALTSGLPDGIDVVMSLGINVGILF